MPSVTNRSGQLYNPVLTNIARQYRPTGFVADQVAPRVNVTKEAGQYVIFGASDFFRTDVDLLKPDRAKTKEVDLGITTATFVAEEYSVKASISRRERDQADNILNLRQAKTNLVMDQLALAREVRVATKLKKTTTGELTSGAAPSNNWNVDAATIELDTITAKDAVYDLIGQGANTAVIPFKVAEQVAIQQDIREVLKYTVNGQQLLSQGEGILPAKLWGLNILVPEGRRATNNEGGAAAFTDIWGDDVRVLYVNPNAAYGSPSVAYTFQTRAVEIRTYSEDDPELEWIVGSEIVAEVVTAPDAGYEIQDVLS